MNMTVSLTEEQENLVRAKLSTGRYASASDVVQEALMLMENHEQAEADKLAWLRDAYQTGLASGDAGELDFMALKAEARTQFQK